MGTQGKVISIFSDKNSYLAAWLMMKRGCRIYPVEFINGFSCTSINSNNEKDRYIDQLGFLRPWASNIKLHSIVLDQGTSNEPTYNLLVHGFQSARFQEYLDHKGAKGICLSIDLTELQTLSDNMKASVPIFFPLIGLKKESINILEDRIKIG